MDHLENILLLNNPIITTQVFSKIVQNIIKTTNEKNEEDKSVPGIQFLKEKCVNFENKISIEASNAILYLIECGLLDTKSILNELLTTITTSKCPSHLAYLLNKLIMLEYFKAVEPGCIYNLKFPQHPFLVLLNENEHAAADICKTMRYTLLYENEKTNEMLAIYRPVLLVALCNPVKTLIQFKENVWKLIIQFDKCGFTISYLLPWINFENRQTIEENANLLIDLKQTNQINYELLLHFQFAALYQLLVHGFEPLPLIYCLTEALQSCKFDSNLSSTLFILSNSILICPSVYLIDLLKLCRIVLEKCQPNYIIQCTIKAALLPWIANVGVLTNRTIQACKELLNQIEAAPRKLTQTDKTNDFYKANQILINSNPEIYHSVQLTILTERWKNEDEICDFLICLKNEPWFFQQKIVNFLYGLLLINVANLEITQFVLTILLEINNKKSSINFLTLILYKLTNSVNQNLQLRLLRALPQMANLKMNQQKVINAIHALNAQNSTSMKTTSVRLMFDVWQVENKSYPDLERLLVAPIKADIDIEEFYVTRAHVLHQLCILKPELYGKEMVAHLSRILNECNHPNGALASAIALKGITQLCKSEIIDAVTTWSTLAPMFQTETRIKVIESVCRFFGEIPHLSYIDSYHELQAQVVEKLWNYVQLYDESVEHALDALTNFPLELVTGQAIAALQIEEENTTEVWSIFLKHFSKAQLQVGGNFLIKLIRSEIDGYLKFVYQVHEAREPINYTILPANSVVRCLMTYVRSESITWKGSLNEDIFVECLRILAQQYSKPLPPQDWCFLQELAHDEVVKQYCIEIGCHQVMLSGTARRFIVNYIEAVTENATQGLIIYENLHFIANSIQPFTLKPFIEGTIRFSIEEYNSGRKQLLETYLNHLIVTLKDDKIQEANKYVIVDVIHSEAGSLPIESSLYNTLLKSIIHFPTKFIQQITSHKEIDRLSHDWAMRAIKIRCYLAEKIDKSALNWLNEIIEIGSKCLSSKTYIIQQFTIVFHAHKNNTESAFWLYELLGQIQSLIVEKRNVKDLAFYCDCLILAIVYFSGYSIFVRIFEMDELRKVFPRAVASLLDDSHWSICTVQAMEWFHHVITNKILSDDYLAVFKECLQCLKQEEEFQKNQKWQKYLNVESI